jgi:hypothetical protein
VAAEIRRRAQQGTDGDLPRQAQKFSLDGLKLFERKDRRHEMQLEDIRGQLPGGISPAQRASGLNRELDYNAYAGGAVCKTRRGNSVRFVERSPGDTTPRSYPESREDLTTDYFWIFPNWMLNCYPDNISLNIVLPLAA